MRHLQFESMSRGTVHEVRPHKSTDHSLAGRCITLPWIIYLDDDPVEYRQVFKGVGGGGGMISDFKKNTENILRTNARERNDQARGSEATERREGVEGGGGDLSILGVRIT